MLKPSSSYDARRDLELGAAVPEDEHHFLAAEVNMYQTLKRQIDELRSLHYTEHPRHGLKPKTGNPAVVGLAGFGLTTMVLQYHNIGWMESMGPVVWLGLIFGGLAQFIAGLQEFSTGNNLAYSAFTTYGAFWISLGLMLIGNHFKVFTCGDYEVGCFLVAFTCYTFITMIGSAGTNCALFFVFVTLEFGFILLDIGHLNKDAHAANQAAGWVLLACALAAFYTMAHVIYHDVYGRDILPVGPAPSKLVMDLHNRIKGLPARN